MKKHHDIYKARPFTYILFNKPFNVLSQFTDSHSRPTLADYGKFPRDVYPVGRLDFDSEGILLLTNDNSVKSGLLNPKKDLRKSYLAQIENIPSEESLRELRRGVNIDRKRTKPAEIEILSSEPHLPPRPIPIRFRKNIPIAWLHITLTEGRNRQVRKMTAAIGHPTLRLVRIAIEHLTIEGLLPGESRHLTSGEILELKVKVQRQKMSPSEFTR
jgi:23S rRNA pseudouridine2457 synthase